MDEPHHHMDLAMTATNTNYGVSSMGDNEMMDESGKSAKSKQLGLLSTKERFNLAIIS